MNVTCFEISSILVMQDNWLLFLISRHSTLLRVVVRGQLQSKYSIPILAIHYILLIFFGNLAIYPKVQLNDIYMIHCKHVLVNNIAEIVFKWR